MQPVILATGSYVRVLPNGMYQRVPLETIEEQPLVGEGYMCADGDSTWVTNCLPVSNERQACYPTQPVCSCRW